MRRESAVKKIEERSLEKERAIEKMKEWSAKMKEILKRKRLHEEMKEEWKIRENEEE